MATTPPNAFATKKKGRRNEKEGRGIGAHSSSSSTVQYMDGWMDGLHEFIVFIRENVVSNGTAQGVYRPILFKKSISYQIEPLLRICIGSVFLLSLDRLLELVS
jgi:hypothetical protein